MSIHSANLILQGPSRTSEINAEDDDSFFQAPANANVSVNLTTTSSVSLTTTTHWNSTDRLSTPGIYFCYPEDGNGYRDIKKVMASILPEHELRDVSKLGQNKLIRRQDPKYLIADYTNEYDVFLIGRKSTACSAQMSDWLLENFNGHFVFFSGETEWAHPVAGARVDRSRYHFFGSQHSFQAMRSTDLMLTYMQTVWWGVFIERLSPQMMVDPSQRPRGRIEPEHTRPSNYMIYGHGNCVNFREAAAGLLSEFGIVHCDGRCQGATPPSGNRRKCQFDHDLKCQLDHNDTLEFNGSTFNSSIYSCVAGNGDGYGDIKKVMASILPEYEFKDMKDIGSLADWRGPQYEEPTYIIPNYTNEYDVFLSRFSGTDCSGRMGDWLMKHYNGHFVFFSAESDSTHPVDPRLVRSRHHVFGPVPVNGEPLRSTDVTLTFMQMVWWSLFTEHLSPQMMVDPSQRPRGRIEPEHTRPSNYMIYGHGNCIGFRETAAGLLSEFGIVHCDGRCQGATPPSGNRTNLVKTNHDVSIANWEKNIDTYSEYRFCLVLEHSIGHETYISEKILMAFIGGCIPIYYGPELIFDIFNRKAFLFYNISDPQPALDQIKLLENDETLYTAMMKEPIVANGNATIEKSRGDRVFGPVPVNGEPLRSTDVTLTFMQMVWWSLFTEHLSPQMMVDPSQRPRGRIEPEHTRPSNYMIYGHGNCVNFREAAAGLLSEFGIVHCDGRCQGATPPSGNRTNLVKTNHDVSIANWEKNIDTYSEYRFCLVLEHSIGHETYISEKILMAFIGGCIPIYYGPELIFDIFNRKAFLFYNISDPQPALDQIKLLENDETLYTAMMKEPIVANGNATIEKYFSFNDTIGNGSLKRRFREKLGVENLVP
eukprot:CAMPEP_0197259044 /NCGR_PEP_ID=MMETSP1429-20130617/83312_1 /TAXON_ID=49237 /ORGANISM="Chaetoceros  sp., Strain UNC1202" /LENGTH=876 /DNA_ID=CAMNT_0042723243 /DNA_START=132 /DNA_END=2763 /DNA_ORIENTATION=-